jgi:hypothetical protein
MTKADDSTIIAWQLKCLRDAGSELTRSEIGLLVSFESQFQNRGTLSEKQMEILEEIYKRRT